MFVFTGRMPGDWDRQAACRGAGDVMLEKPVYGRNARRRRHVTDTQAKAICRSCPVLDECRTWVLSEPDPVRGMIAAGMTTSERTDTRRGRTT